MKRGGKNWSHDEEKILIAHYPEHGSRWDGWEALLPGRTDSAIRSHAATLLLRKEREGDNVTRRKREILSTSMRKDPYEELILDCLERGMTTKDIDSMMKWRPGKSKLILTERWSRTNNA